jgi:hypothetical protein
MVNQNSLALGIPIDSIRSDFALGLGARGASHLRGCSRDDRQPHEPSYVLHGWKWDLMHPSKREARPRRARDRVVVDRSMSANDAPRLEQAEQLRVAQRLVEAMRTAGYVCELNDDPRSA